MKKTYIRTALLALMMAGTVLSSTSCSMLMYHMLDPDNIPVEERTEDLFETLPPDLFPPAGTWPDDETLPEGWETISETTTAPEEECDHNWIDATCQFPRTCSECGDTQGSVIDHDYVESVLEPATCSKNGSKQFTCWMCEDSYTEPYVLEEFSADKIYSSSVQSVGEILTYDSSGAEYAIGTGFVLSSDGKIVTNYHVIEDACSAKITINGTAYTVSSVLAYDQTIDLAILQIDANDLVPMPICQTQHAVGKSVYALGSSYGLTATFSRGIITYANRQIDGVSYIQHDAAISGGNSGGPLINGYGEIIGINTWTVRDSQNLNFAISVSELNNLVYGTPLTLQEFYDKECNPLTKLTTHITQNGTYNSETVAYELLLGSQYSTDNTNEYIRKAYYSEQNNIVGLCLFIDSDYVVCITVDKADGEYEWYYLDLNNYWMTGILQASSYSDSTQASYSNTNIVSSYRITSTLTLASDMINYLCSYINTDFQSIDVTAADLGFVNY